MNDWNNMSEKPNLPEQLHSPAGFPFRLVLPLGQLLLCAILLLPVRGRIFAEFRVPLRMIAPPLIIRYGGPLTEWFVQWSCNNGIKAVAFLNLPAGIVQFPLTIFSTSHQEWTPGGIDFHVWRAITWPILGMAFWWIAGRGAEAVAASAYKKPDPRIRWIEAITGFLLSACSLTVAIGISFFAGADRHDPDLQLLWVVAALWTFLGSLPITGKIAQWRLQKRLTVNPLTSPTQQLPQAKPPSDP